jgi:hypothetical protein
MSISAVNGVSPTAQQASQPQGVTAIPKATSFGQELDAQSARTHGHHHHHGGGSQSATSSAATAASAAGAASSATVGSSLLKLVT